MTPRREKQHKEKCLYLREGSAVYWIRLSIHGKKVRESTGEKEWRKAKAFLDRRKAEIQVEILNPKGKPVTVGDLVEEALGFMRTNKAKSAEKSEERWRVHLKEPFENVPAKFLGTDTIRAYIKTRQEEKAANGTINRELALLKRAYSIAFKETTPPKVNSIPHIPKLEENNIRRGFLELEAHLRLEQECGRISKWMLGIYLTGYTFGFRSAEVTSLLVGQIDMVNGCIRLDDTKKQRVPRGIHDAGFAEGPHTFVEGEESYRACVHARGRIECR